MMTWEDVDRDGVRLGIMTVAPQYCSGGKSEVPECLSEGSSRSRLGREPGLTHFSGYFAVWYRSSPTVLLRRSESSHTSVSPSRWSRTLPAIASAIQSRGSALPRHS
jgi:hypothetical protein